MRRRTLEQSNVGLSLERHIPDDPFCVRIHKTGENLRLFRKCPGFLQGQEESYDCGGIGFHKESQVQIGTLLLSLKVEGISPSEQSQG